MVSQWWALVGMAQICAFDLPPMQKTTTTKKILWSFPDPGTSALNTDGCPKGNPGPASIIGIIRDDRGVWICGYDGKIPDTTSLEAELWSIFKRLSLVRDRRIPRLMVETDSQVAIELIQDKEKGQGYSYNVPPTNIRRDEAGRSRALVLFA